MIDTRKTKRVYEIKGVKITVTPYYSMGNFGGYTAAAYNTTQNYPAYLNRRFIKYTPVGIDEYTTCLDIAYDFYDYYLPSTRLNCIDY